MLWAQACLRHYVALTGLFIMFYVQICQCYRIDQIIADAMKSSHGSARDETHKTVTVDMDMVFTVDDWAKITALNNNSGGVHTLHRRHAIKEWEGSTYWPQGIVYYEIDRRQFSWREIGILQAAMEEWMRHTCIQFRPAQSTTRNKIRFTNGLGCRSSVGMTKYPQTVTLARNCRVKGVVIHELGHVLGFYHEQSRPDRDNYVKIRWENIRDDLEYIFHKYKWTFTRDLGVSYDYLSIMHYGKDAFSSNYGVTIETLDPKYQDLIGNRRTLSFRDIKSANILYNCRPTSSRCRLRDEDCPGEGFVSKDCTCWCPTWNDQEYRYRSKLPYYVCSDDSRKINGDGTDSESRSTESAGGDRYRGSGSSDCKDENVNCEMWASRGDCHVNRLYMEEYCRRACGLCDTVTPSCHDEYSRCAFWKQEGFCDKSSLLTSFLTRHCKRTCGFCKTTSGPKRNKTLPCERTCTNENEQCQTWAAQGECTATPDYMQRYCRKACNLCCQS